MKLSIKRKELLTMLEFAKRFINKTSTIPILRNVCIIAGKE
nr:MAG TPA: beta clamp protein [Caudoviricetes sp.]